MGMSGYVMDIEEAFWGTVSKIIKESEHVNEAMIRAVDLSKPMVPYMSVSDIEDGVSEMWNDFWSEHQQ